jgi:hypothetical protein
MRTFLKSFLAAAAITAAATSAQASTRIFQYLENDPGTIQLVNGPSGYTLSTVGTPTVFATLTNPNTGERARGDAIFNFTATGSGFATDLGGGRFVQSLTGGSLSFTAAEDFVIGSRTFAAGSNLLSLDFLGGFIEVNVNGTTGASEVTIPGDSFSNVQFALFSFPPAEFLGFTIGLSGTQFAVGNLAPNCVDCNILDFTANSVGTFNAAVPEPGTWAMMLAGFGLVGLARRRSSRPATVAA